MQDEREFTATEKIGEWRQAVGAAPGIMEKILHYDPETGNYTRLARFPPGIEVTNLQRHDFCEEVLILEGTLTDTGKNFTAKAGDYACRPVGMPHGPYTTADGCLNFEIRYQDPEKPLTPDCSLLKEHLGRP